MDSNSLKQPLFIKMKDIASHVELQTSFMTYILKKMPNMSIHLL